MELQELLARAGMSELEFFSLTASQRAIVLVEAAAGEWKRGITPAKARLAKRRSAARKKEQVVYFLAAGPFVKIGHSHGDATERVKELQTGCPFDARVVALMKGGREEEAALHRRFASYRTTREWFRLEGELATFVESLKGAA